MLNIIRADLYRIIRNKTIFIMAIMIIAIDVATIILKDPQLMNMFHPYYGYQEAGNFGKFILSQNCDLYFYLIFIVYAFMITDFSNKTARNTLSSVCGRKMYYTVKSTEIYISSAVLYLLHCIFCYVLNLILNGTSDSIGLGHYLKIVLLQFPLILGIIGFILMCAFLVRESKFSVLVIITPFTFALVFYMIITYNKTSQILQFIYDHVFMENVFYNFANSADYQSLSITIIVYLIFAVFSTLIGYASFKKCEIP